MVGNLVSQSVNGATTQFEYNALRQVTKVVDPMGNVTSSVYDAGGVLTEATNPLGGVTTYESNNVRQVTESVDPNGNVTGREYDADGNLSHVSVASEGKPSKYEFWAEYDSNHNIVAMTDGLGQTTQYKYEQVTPQIPSSEVGYQKVVGKYQSRLVVIEVGCQNHK